MVTLDSQSLNDTIFQGHFQWLVVQTSIFGLGLWELICGSIGFLIRNELFGKIKISKSSIR